MCGVACSVLPTLYILVMIGMHCLTCEYSWNTRGINSPQKLSLVFFVLRKYRPHIVCLQETHLTGSRVRALKRPWLAQSYHATHMTCSRGVSILLVKSLSAEIFQIETDPNRRFIVLTLQIASVTLTLVNVYIPPLPFSIDVLSK